MVNTHWLYYLLVHWFVNWRVHLLLHWLLHWVHTGYRPDASRINVDLLIPVCAAIFSQDTPDSRIVLTATRSIAGERRGLPKVLPLRRARSIPARVRSEILILSCLATAAKIPMTASRKIPQESMYCSV
jgi:hypothetical protein